MRALGILSIVAVIVQSLALAAGLVAPASAAERSQADLLALLQPPVYTDLIGVQVVLRNVTLEQVRRAMLLDRCAALDRRFPKAATPAFAAVLSKSENWALRGDHSISAARFGIQDEMQALLGAMVQHGLSDADLAAWVAFKTSDTGRRALAVESMVGGIDAVGMRSVDAVSGVAWSWPLERLRRLADATGLRGPFDATLEQVRPGSAAKVAKLTGDTTQLLDPADSDALTAAFEKGDFVREFLSHVPPADRKAYQQSQSEPVSARLAKAQTAIGGILQPEAGGLSTFCQRSGLLHCEASTPIAAKAQALHKRFVEASQENIGLTPLRELIRKLPEAACSAR